MDDVAIKLEGLHKSFKLPHEKNNSLKGAFVNVFRGKRTYETQKVLKDVSFEIKKGEFFGIVGRNGSGKSTLLKLLAGIYTPDKGSVKVNGKLTPFIELGVGFNPELTGRENVFLNGALLGFSRKEMLSLYDEIVTFAELKKFMDQKLKNYSSGMQVRLAFSIAIQAKSDILVLDEVLAVGDASFQDKCKEYFKLIKGTDKTVVLVTHDMSSVTEFCNRAILVNKGKIVLDADPVTVAEAYQNINFTDNNVIDSASDLIQANAEIIKVSIENDTGNKIEGLIRKNQSIILRVQYRLTRKVENAVVDFGLRDGLHGPYLVYRNFTDKEMRVSGRKGQLVNVKISLKNMINGTILYFATSLYDPETYEVHARNRHALKIKTQHTEGEGLISIDNKAIIEVI